MWVDWFLALRILRDARMQSLLIVAGVAMGVTVMVFLSSLITGLQVSLLDKTLGAQAHVIIRPAEERARPLLGDQVVRRVETTAQRTRSIDGWQQLIVALDDDAEIVAVSPSATALSSPSVATAPRRWWSRASRPSGSRASSPSAIACSGASSRSRTAAR